MPIARAWRRLGFCAAVAGVAIFVASCARHPYGGPHPLVGPPQCKGLDAPVGDLVPLNQSVAYLHRADGGKYRRCASLLASKQTILPSSSNDYPQTIPADPACGATTTIKVGAYKSSGDIRRSMYGDGAGKYRGFVLARIENTGSCPSIAPFKFRPGDVIYWVVDQEKNATSPTSHFIYESSGDFVDGKENWAFDWCGHPPTTGSGDRAMYKRGDPCADYGTTPPHPFEETMQQRGRGPNAELRLFFDGEEVWIFCGDDCCYANRSI